MRNRQSIRLQNFDYSHHGAYFITLCTSQRECLFGEIGDGAMRTNTIGDLIAQIWHSLPQRFSQVTLDAFVVMPNHVHGIVCIGEIADTSRRGAACCALNEIGTAPNKSAASRVPTTAPTPALGNIIRAFKSISAIAANRLLQRNGQPLWQRNYYERIIRDDEEWNRIREYIINNPACWDDDVENPLRMNDDRAGL